MPFVEFFHLVICVFPVVRTYSTLKTAHLLNGDIPYSAQSEWSM